PPFFKTSGTVNRLNSSALKRVLSLFGSIGKDTRAPGSGRRVNGAATVFCRPFWKKSTYTFPILSARFLDVDTLFGTRSSNNNPSSKTNLRIVSIEYFGTTGIRKWKPSAPDVLII